MRREEVDWEPLPDRAGTRSQGTQLQERELPQVPPLPYQQPRAVFTQAKAQAPLVSELSKDWVTTVEKAKPQENKRVLHAMYHDGEERAKEIAELKRRLVEEREHFQGLLEQHYEHSAGDSKMHTQADERRRRWKGAFLTTTIVVVPALGCYGLVEWHKKRKVEKKANQREEEQRMQQQPQRPTRVQQPMDVRPLLAMMSGGE